MKKSTIVELKEISDSREVLAEHPHRFVTWFVYILILLLAAALIWACIGETDYYIKAQGEVRPNESVSVIRNTITGRILEVNLSEGQQVKKGDLLFTMDVEELISTSVVLERQLESINNEISNLEKYRTSVMQGVNLFDANVPKELDYYLRYQKYTTDRDIAIEQVKNTNLDITRLYNDSQVAQNNAQKSIGLLQEEIGGFNLLLRSVDEGNNLIPESNAKHFSSFENYKADLNRYDAVIDNYQKQYDRALALYEVGDMSKKQFEAAQFDLESAKNDKEKYINEFRLNIHQNLDSLNKNMSDLNATIRSASVVTSAYSEHEYSEELIAEKSKLDTLAPIPDTLFNLQNNADALQKELNSVRLNIAEADVIAPIDGRVSMNTEMTPGDFLQGGMEIAEIIPGTDGNFKVVLAVLNSDIADIQEEQIVHLRFGALPYQEYGEVDGKVTNICNRQTWLHLASMSER